MISRYAVGFLISKNAKRNLTDDGWEFESNSRLPASIESLLESELSLNESSSNFSSYDGPKLKASIFKDEYGNIENVYFRFYDNTEPVLPDYLNEIKVSEQLEFFIPV